MNAAKSRHLAGTHSHKDASKRPAVDLAEKVDRFVTKVAEKEVGDKKVLDIDQLIEIKDQLKQVVEVYERRPEFKVKDEMSARKRELDRLIETAEEDYATSKREHDLQVTAIDNQLLENHRHVLEVQQQTLVKEIKSMNEYLFYHQKILQQIADIDAALDAESCCSKFFCCCFPSKNIQEKQKQLRLLRDEQDAFASEDHTVVSQILSRKIEESRAELLQKQSVLAVNQPQETAQLLRDERTRLQVNIDAERNAYYHTISPTVMLNLVRLQSFLKRASIKLNKAKSSVQADNNTLKIGFLDAVLSLVDTFLKKFNEYCADYVCRPPANEALKISYAQYCERYHKLQKEEKKSIIKGEAKQAVLEGIFNEHMEDAIQPALSMAHM